MDVTKLVLNGGFTQIPNPAYNSRSKKNKEPQLLTVQQTTPTTSKAVNMAIMDFNNQYSITKEENDKYSKYGLNYSPLENMDMSLYEAQSNWKKIGNSLAQTLVSELAIGIPKSFSDLIDFVGQAVGLSDPNYTNPVSQYLEEKQEEFRKFAPIYANPNSNILNGGLLDMGWWTSNFPSIISSLTLLLPSMGITKLGKLTQIGKLVSYGKRYLPGIEKALAKTAEADRLRKAGATAEEIAKAGKLNAWEKVITSDKIRNATNLAFENTTTAALSRTMENYQEARQTYNDVYLQAKEAFNVMSDEDYAKVKERNKDLIANNRVNPENRDAVAKLIAKAGADETFRLDFLNIGWDVIQLYALRGLFTGKGVSPSKSASVRRAEKDAEKYAGKTQQQIAEIKANRKFKEKAKDWLEDRAYSSKLVIGAELSEGAEEALNYVAQQEGMHLGNVLTGQLNDNHNVNFWENLLSGFDGRLRDYVKAPGLWDSAFWGVLGGVTFQGLGSKARQIQQKLEKSNLSKGEKEQLPWYRFDELPENKARITEIQGRQITTDEYLAKLKKINEGIDLNNPKGDKLTPAQQELARKQLRDEYEIQMALNAMQVGNLDSLRAYFANDNVRKAMIAAGFFDEVDSNGNPVQKTDTEKETESKQYVEEVLKRFDQIEETYNRELITVNDIVSYLNTKAKRRDRIPTEYIQIMADRNVRRKLAGQTLNQSIQNIAAEANKIHTELVNNKTIDGALDYESMVNLKGLSDELGVLRVAMKEILSKKELTLSDRISLKNIEKQIDYLQNRIKEQRGEVALNWAIHRSLQFIKKPDGYYRQNTPESLAFKAETIDNRIVNATEKHINFSDILPMSYVGRGKVLTDAEVGQFDTLESDVENNVNNLANTSKTLYNLYIAKAQAQIQIEKLESEITNDIDSVRDYVGTLYNTMDEARKKAINEAYTTIKNLYKNKKQETLNALGNLRKNKPIDTIQGLTDAEKASLKSAIDALAISNRKNGDIIGDIFDLLKIQDDIEFNAQRNNPQAQPTSQPTPVNLAQPASQPNPQLNQPNPTPSQPSQSSQNPQLNNPSAQPQQGSNQAQGGQNQGSQPIIDPQNIQNRTPTHTVGFPIINGKKVSGTFNLYINGSEPYTMVNVNSTDGYKNSDIYENADSIDLLSGTPFEEIHPRIIVNNDGTWTVVEKGRVGINANQNTQGQQANTAQPAPTQPAPSTVAQPEHEITSTGEVEGSTTSSEESRLSTVNVETTLKRKIGSELIPKVSEMLKANVKDYDAIDKYIDTMAEQYINYGMNNGLDRATAEQIINQGTKFIRKFVENYKKRDTSLNSSITEVYIRQEVLDSVSKANELSAVIAYRKAMYDMLSQYCHELKLEEHNNKYYIVLEDLLRYINKTTSDSSMANILFNSLKEHLLSDEAKEKYIVVDENEVNKTNFLDNVAKSAEERLRERENSAIEQSVDLNRVLEESGPSQYEETYEAIESLKPNDKLGVEVDRSKRVVYVLNDKGQKVGSMPMPYVDDKTGAYEITNDGWIYNILVSTNGDVQSPLFNWLSHIFRTTNNASKELFDLVIEYTFDKTSKERKEQIYKAFGENAEIKAIRNNLISTEASTEKLMNGLSKLFRFMFEAEGIDIYDKSEARSVDRSLRLWFRKLNESYDLAFALANGANFNLTVKSVLLGDIIRIHEKVDFNNLQDLSTPDKAFAGGLNTNEHKIAITDPRSVNSVMIAGKPNESFNSRQGNTFVILTNPIGDTEFIQVYPVQVTDNDLGKEAKEIISAIKQEAFKLFKEYNNTPNTENRNKIQKFFETLLRNYNGNSSLFGNIATGYIGDNKGFKINAGDNGIIIIYNNQRQPNNVKIGIGKEGNIKIDSKEFENLLNNIINKLQFRFSYSYFASDNNTNMNLEGIAKRKDGKFVITIGEKSWEFNSFNDFVLGQNLVRVNTKPNENGTSNFNRGFTRNTKIHQSFKINITSPTSSPVEESTLTQTPTPIKVENTDISTDVLNILNSNNEEKGNAIFRRAIGTIKDVNNVFTEKTLNALEHLGLLPKNIIFDPEFQKKVGEDINAAYNPKTKQVIVGQKWLDMFNNPTTREQAIRKLIHEQIHAKIREEGKKGNKAVKSIQNIYDEFKEALENKDVQDKLIKEGLNIEQLKNYLFEGNKDALEEFLVESLTSRELVKALNNIDAKGYKKGKLRNLFQELLKALAELFGWGIREGSLYEKELYTIRTSFSEKKETKKETKKDDKTKEKYNQSSLFSDEETKDNGVPNVQPEPIPEPTPEPKVEERVIVEQPKIEEPTSTQKSQTENKPSEFGERKRRDRNRAKSKLSSVTELPTTNIDNFSTSNDDIRYSSVTEMTPKQKVDKIINDTKNLNFKNVLYRAQSSIPIIDENDNLILKPRYDSLFRNWGLSFATKSVDAMDFGTRDSVNPYLIEVDTYYLDKVIPLDRNANTKTENVRTIGDEYLSGGHEQRLQMKYDIIIPKGRYKISRKRNDYSSFTNGELINMYITTYSTANSADEIVYSGDYSRLTKGVTSFSDAEDILEELANRVGGMEQAKELIDIDMYRQPWGVPSAIAPFYDRKHYEDKGIDISEYEIDEQEQEELNKLWEENQKQYKLNTPAKDVYDDLPFSSITEQTRNINNKKEFDDNIEKLSDNLDNKIEYEDTFRKIFENNIPNKEKGAILIEARNKFGAKPYNELIILLSKDFKNYINRRESKSIGNAILNFFRDLFTSIRNYLRLKPTLKNYYDNVNKNKYNTINVVNKNGEILLDLEKALNNNPFAKTFIEKLVNKGYVLSGSASYSTQGTVYRKEQDNLHDIDLIADSQHLNDPGDVLDMLGYNNMLVNEFKNIRTYVVSKYKLKKVDGKLRVDTGQEEFTAKQVKDREVPYTMLVDFIIEPREGVKTIKTNIAGINLTLQDRVQIENAKLDMSRDKDISDIINFRTNNLYSSVTELAHNVPSVSEFTNRLPISQQAKFAHLIENGELSTSCL